MTGHRADSVLGAKPEPEAPNVSSPTNPRPVLRKVVGPLVIYHALILLGAFLILASGLRGLGLTVGAILVGAGISMDIAVIVWSASLTRRAARQQRTSYQLRGDRRAGPGRTLCPACGRMGTEGTVTCPRCGRTVIQLGWSD